MAVVLSGDPRRAASAPVALRLYVAGQAPNSVAALANLRALLLEGADGAANVEVVDVLKEPARALADGVVVSPTLLRLRPLPLVRIVGNLSNREAVRHALGLTETSS